MATSLPVFPKFETNGDTSSLGHRWEKYFQNFENLFVGMNIESRKRRKALLLHYSGDDVFDIYQTLSDTGDENGYEETKAALTKYSKPQVNEEFEIFQFRQMKQLESETVDEFTTRLRKKAEYCGFTDKSKEIKSQLVQGCKSAKLRRKVLQENLTLDKLLLAARTMELANNQAKEMENGHSGDLSFEETNKVKSQKIKKRTERQKKHYQNSNAAQRTVKCHNCGGDFPHKQGPCPAKGKFCAYCKKQNHFVSVCLKKKRKDRHKNGQYGVKQVDLDSVSCSDSESETLESENSDLDISFGIRVNQVKRKPPKTDIIINGLKCRLLVDFGSSINLLNESLLDRMKTRPVISRTDTKAYAYGQKQKLPIKGKFTATVETSRKITTAVFYIIGGNNDSLLSYDTSVQLDSIPEINSVHEENKNNLGGNVQYLLKKYPELFQGIGKLKDTKIKLHIDENVPPVAQHHRRIPFHMREKVEKELERLERLDIIEKVDGPTDWVSPIVVAPRKNGDIRICVDMRKANEAIKRERHITPTIDYITSNLNGAKVFSKMDMNNGFHQCEISPESRNITVFSPHVGLRCYKRLNYGISASPEIFNNEIRKALEGLDGSINISDDINYGKDQQDHDKNLQAVFERLKQKNLTLNKSKCLFSQKEVKFFGYIFSENGISADPEMVESIKNAKEPTTPSEVKSFLGMTGFVSRFIPQYSTLTEPLRKLTRENETWVWSDEQESAFQTLKDKLTSDTVMAYFDPSKETELWVDASPVGLGAILSQDNKIVAYASRALSPVEQRYSQTERECLAIVYGVEHFHLFLFGKSFTLISDHKPLTAIFGTAKLKNKQQSLRLEHWRLRLATYDFNVTYKKGDLMISDYMSRHPFKDCSAHNSAEDYVRLIASNSVPKALDMCDVASATQEDKTL